MPVEQIRLVFDDKQRINFFSSAKNMWVLSRISLDSNEYPQHIVKIIPKLSQNTHLISLTVRMMMKIFPEFSPVLFGLFRILLSLSD